MTDHLINATEPELGLGSEPRLGHTTFTTHGYILYILKAQMNMYRHILGCRSATNMVVMYKGVACSTV